MSSNATGMLSESSVKAIATRLNEKVDFPFIGESREQTILEKLVKELDAKLGSILPSEFYELVNIVADGVSEKELEHLKERLPEMLNKEINIPFLSEETEGKLFSFFVEQVCEALKKGNAL